MRSSIACARCRRSKIKCVNAGIDTTCRACESSGRECAYPTPAIGGGAAAAKRDLAALADGDERNGHPDWESPKRQRSRKSVGLAAAAAKEAAAKASLDALDAPVLTVKVWETVFDLFQSHVATLLPFLHPASFLAQIRPLAHGAATAPASPPGAHAPAPPPNPLIPLGVLALTARFHPTLVAYHAPTGAGAGGPDPLVASEVYATALRARLAGVDGSSLAVPDLTRVQALLMLALHEWGMCRGKSAWLYVGMAIRLAQAMGLPWELEQDGVAPAASAPLQVEAELFGLPRRPPPAREPTADDIIAQETKRRTFWACFLLDRCLSSGRYRPRMIRVRDLGIQLPSDNAFAFGERVRTARLGEPPARRPPSFGTPGAPVIPSLRQSLGGFTDDPRSGPASDAHHHHHHHHPSAWSPVARRSDAAATGAVTDDEGIDRWEVGAEESVLGRVIRIVRLWGSIAQWSCAGGRRTEPVAPWHPESRFAHLRARLAEFQDGLARNLQYSSRNTETHIMYRNSLAPYTVMHVVYFLSVIVLHRAYIPFLPVHCPGPIGPLDEPGAVAATDPTATAGGPDGFWRDSARELFGAARRMMDLVLTCQERGVLVENPLVGFAVYHAAFVGVYAAHFPHMDPDGALRPPPGSPTPPPDGPPRTAAVGPSPARQMLDLLRRMRPRLRMARGWFRTVNRLHSYFAKVRRDVRRHSRRPDATAAADDAGPDGLRPVREGGAGGGLDEFRLIEKLFLDFGTIEDQLPDTGSDASGDGGPVVAAASTAAPPAGPVGSDRATNPSDAGSSVARSETGDPNEDPSGDGVVVPPNGRRESWVPVNSPGLPPRGPDGDRRPSLPLPTTSRSLQSQSPFSLPALPPPPPPPPAPTDAPLYGHPSPTLPSLGTASSQAPRLQPLNSWLPPRGPPPPYAQSLPPISATTAAHGLPLLPPPGTVGGPGGSSPGTADGWDSLAPPPGLWSTSLGGDDVLAFLEGCDYDQLPSPTASELGLSTGWLSTVWTEFAR